MGLGPHRGHATGKLTHARSKRVLLWRPRDLPRNDAPLEQHDPVGHGYERLEVVGDQQNRGSTVAFLGEDVGQQRAPRSIERGERLIEELVEAGELVETDITARALALTIVSPVLLALLHQHELGGEQCRALDVSAFASTHLDLVLKGLST